MVKLKALDTHALVMRMVWFHVSNWMMLVVSYSNALCCSLLVFVFFLCEVLLFQKAHLESVDVIHTGFQSGQQVALLRCASI